MTKQVKEVTHQPLTPINTAITQKQLLDDLHYRQAKQIIQHLLDKGLISANQFPKIDRLNKPNACTTLSKVKVIASSRPTSKKATAFISSAVNNHLRNHAWLLTVGFRLTMMNKLVLMKLKLVIIKS